jgi:hypothetical protein
MNEKQENVLQTSEKFSHNGHVYKVVLFMKRRTPWMTVLLEHETKGLIPVEDSPFDDMCRESGIVTTLLEDYPNMLHGLPLNVLLSEESKKLLRAW